jgi:hypothetical protein
MGKIVKSVSLDPETDAIAGMIPNFSRFVRNCLRRYHATLITPICRTDEAHIVGGYCIPSAKRLCLACWPNGPPDYPDWKSFGRSIKFLEVDGEDFPLLLEQAREWVQEKAMEANPGMIDFTDIPMKGNAKPEKKVKAKKGIIARILRL